MTLPSLLAAAGGILLGAALGWALGRRTAGEQRARADALQGQLDAAAAAPEVWEGRIEHFDVLWFPVVTASRQTRKVVSVKAGVPHCPKCAAALTLARGEWACADCDTRRPESLADLMVVDAIAKQALEQFLQRRRDYRAEGSTAAL